MVHGSVRIDRMLGRGQFGKVISATYTPAMPRWANYAKHAHFCPRAAKDLTAREVSASCVVPCHRRCPLRPYTTRRVAVKLLEVPKGTWEYNTLPNIFNEITAMQRLARAGEGVGQIIDFGFVRSIKALAPRATSSEFADDASAPAQSLRTSSDAGTGYGRDAQAETAHSRDLYGRSRDDGSVASGRDTAEPDDVNVFGAVAIIMELFDSDANSWRKSLKVSSQRSEDRRVAAAAAATVTAVTTSLPGASPTASVVSSAAGVFSAASPLSSAGPAMTTKQATAMSTALIEDDFDGALRCTVCNDERPSPAAVAQDLFRGTVLCLEHRKAVLALAARAAYASARMHALGVAHFDIKLHNILIQSKARTLLQSDWVVPVRVPVRANVHGAGDVAVAATEAIALAEAAAASAACPREQGPPRVALGDFGTAVILPPASLRAAALVATWHHPRLSGATDAAAAAGAGAGAGIATQQSLPLLVATRVARGTEIYQSPEQLLLSQTTDPHQNRYDRRRLNLITQSSDSWSLTLAAAELWLGRPLYDLSNFFTVMIVAQSLASGKRVNERDYLPPQACEFAGHSKRLIETLDFLLNFDPARRAGPVGVAAALKALYDGLRARTGAILANQQRAAEAEASQRRQSASAGASSPLVSGADKVGTASLAGLTQILAPAASPASTPAPTPSPAPAAPTAPPRPATGSPGPSARCPGSGSAPRRSSAGRRPR